ncbi:hypothetical protein Cgig2_026746 [Carnegiea gigantea]|uniref:Uncharacterized protein n=1 Tax=Carnegiea gigantea TaxID=171969 RepID=A0A9Q1JU88_9CARY|nr:hypothetical protein Cgig2_026746 [Carnegiea gigantea]
MREKIEMNLFPNFASTEQAIEYACDHFRWALRDPLAPGPRLLLSDYHGLCPRFDLGAAARYAHDSNTPEMVQIIFYAMVIDDAAKLGLSRRLTMDCVMWAMRTPDWGPVEAWLGGNGRRLRRAQASRLGNPLANLVDNLRWSVRKSSSLHPDLLSLHFTTYYPEFDHIRAMQFAHAANLPEMVQAIFYAMVINDAVELRHIRWEIGESLMLDLQELKWDIIEAWLLSIDDKLKDAKVPRLVKTVYNPRPRPAVTLRLRDAPACPTTRSSIKIPLSLYIPLMRGVCVTANLDNKTLPPFFFQE